MEGKVLTKLDFFVLDFVDLLKSYTDYVVVSGFVSILFGRSRGTEDIDILTERINSAEFHRLYTELTARSYYFLNPEDEDGLHEMLLKGLGIRVALEGTIIPNIKLKFEKDDFDRYSLHNRIKVWISGRPIAISPIEVQIPYKLWLGSEKDIEDAIYLWEFFKEKLDRALLLRFMEELDVRGEDYGIEVRS